MAPIAQQQAGMVLAKTWRPLFESLQIQLREKGWDLRVQREARGILREMSENENLTHG